MGAYDALDQQDHHAHDSDVDEPDSRSGGSASPIPPPPPPHRSYTRYRRNQGRASNRTKNRNAAPAQYSVIEADEFEEGDIIPVASSTERKHTSPTGETFPLGLKISRPAPRGPCSPAHSGTAESIFSSQSIASKPALRTASGRSIALRHPTPDLQTLQGAYMSNIEHLEKTAERLSMTSSIEDAIKELHDQQKRSDSRRSSLLSSQSILAVSRQVSNASSIVEVNSAARSGGFSPAGYIMSPGGSLTAGSGRGHSMSKRFGTRPEPELEGRPLDSFVNMDASLSPTSPAIPGSESAAEMSEESSAMTKPTLDLLASPDLGESFAMLNEEEDRSGSVHTYEQEGIFEGFDGIHSAPIHLRTVSGNESNDSNNTPREESSDNGLSMARPKSYADPSTGEEMVYYPAPVPMMLNLPQKLSKNQSPITQNKRISQVLSRDMLEDKAGAEAEADDALLQQEYIPQHQRASMGGRRLTQDMSHMPPQLRASTFFELPASNQSIELKEQSAVATLDSLLDASAHAPVTAFTDHALAGRAGADVYGREHMKQSRTSTTLAEPSKKRNSTFNIFFRKRWGSSSNLLSSDEDKRRSTMSEAVESKVRSPIEDGEEDDHVRSPVEQSDNVEGEEDEEPDQGQGEEEEFQEAPNTLLAELQVRKHHQKLRTRPLLEAFPNGMHSTLLEMDAVAQVEQKSRKQKPVTLAWEDPTPAKEAMEDDEEIPLAVLYAKQDIRDPTRPMGLMERREMEDNEPLSRRRDRLQGRQPMTRASTRNYFFLPQATQEEVETPAEPEGQLEEQAAVDNGLPSARPVSGDFTSELMSQFGGDLLDVKDSNGKAKETSTSPDPEEEETLGQRRKRLQAERAAREQEVGTGAAGDTPAQRPEINKRRSMADILQAHPAAGASRNASYEKPVAGLLALHEKASAHRLSTMLDLNTSGTGLINGRRKSSSALRNYNDGQGGIVPPPQQPPGFNAYGNQPMFPQPSLGMGNQAMWGGQMFVNPYAVAYPGMQMGYMPGMAMNGMPMGLGMGMGMQPLNQAQADMVERWRQSVMQ